LRAACQLSETLIKQNDPEAQHALEELDAAIQRLADVAREEA
jgi:two-component system sensor histidine kinase BarA